MAGTARAVRVRGRGAATVVAAGAVVSVVGAAALLTGCRGASHAATATTSAAAAPVVPAATPSGAGSAVRAPSATTASSRAAAAVPLLPAGCPELLSLPAVEAAIGTGLLGEVTYLKAAAVPQSGRLGRVTCGYGVPVRTPAPVGTRQPDATAVAGGQPLLSASYITYVDAKTAAARVALTVQTDGAGAAVQQVSVSGKPASVLVGARGGELVMSDGARTIVLVASPVILTAASAPVALEKMAATMLRFGQPAAPSSAPVSTAAAS